MLVFLFPFTEAEVSKILYPLMLILVIVMSMLFTGCDGDKTTITTTTPKITDVIDDIQPDEVNLDAANNATLPGGGTLDDLIDKSLLEDSGETPDP
jgi:hypothetical protein